MRDTGTNNPQYTQRDDYGNRRSRYDYEDDRAGRQQSQQGQYGRDYGTQGGAWGAGDDRDETREFRGQRQGGSRRYGGESQYGANQYGPNPYGDESRQGGDTDGWGRQNRSFEQQPWSGQDNRGYDSGYGGGGSQRDQGRFDYNQGQGDWNRGRSGQSDYGQSSQQQFFQGAMQGHYGGGSGSQGSGSYGSGSYGSGSHGSSSGGSSTMRGPNAGKGPKNYRRGDDKIIEEVCHQLERDGDIDASEIEVVCREGVITLKGKVADRRAKRHAEECAEQAYGVKDVMNELKVDSGALSAKANSGEESDQSSKTGRKAN